MNIAPWFQACALASIQAQKSYWKLIDILRQPAKFCPCTKKMGWPFGQPFFANY